MHAFQRIPICTKKPPRLSLLCGRQGFHQCRAQLRHRQPSIACPRCDASGNSYAAQLYRSHLFQTSTQPFRSLVHGIVAELLPSSLRYRPRRRARLKQRTHRPNETTHRLTKEKSKSHEQKQQLPTSRRRDETEQIPCNQKKAHTYLDPKHSDWAGSVGAKASVNAERSCVTGSHLSPSFALMPPATARLRSSSRPNSCKRPRSHSAPLFLVLLRNSSHRKPSDERRNWSILPDNPFKQWNCHRATLTRVPGTRLEQKACSACSASNLYPFKLAKLSLPPRKHPSSRHSNH